MPAYRTLLRSVVVVVAVAVIGSCGGGADDGGPGTGPGLTIGPPAASASIVTLSASSVASGSTATATLRAKDANGNNVTAGGATVAFGLAAAGTSAGTFGSVTDNQDGTYTATFTATTAGTPRALTATLGGAAVTTTLPSVTVTPGPFSPTTSGVAVSAATVASGSNSTLTATLRDAASNALTTGGATVAFTLGDGGSAGTLGAVTDNNNGTYSATFTATTVGTARTIGATVNTVAISSTLPTITTTPGPASVAQSTVQTSASSLQVGEVATLTVRARDAADNAHTGGGLTVAFTKGSGTSDGTIGTVTDSANGTYTATFTATTAGTARTIGATIAGGAITSANPTITVTAAPVAPAVASAATSVVSVSSTSVASGATATVTLQAKDAGGTNLTLGGATVAFSLSGSGSSSGTIGSVTDNANGTYTASFTGTTAGSARDIGATLNGTAVSTTMPSVTVIPGAASAATSVVTVGSATVTSSATTALTLTTKDDAGNASTTGGATVVFALGIGTSAGTIGSVTDNGDGTYTATFTGTTAGTARTITASLNGTAVATTSPTITVAAGLISTAGSVVTVSSSYIEVSGTSTITLTAKDANGNSISSGGAMVAFTTGSGTSAGTIGTVTDNTNGTYTATFTGTAVGTETLINATITSAAVTTTKPGITVYAKGMTLSTDSVPAVATSGAMGTAQLVGVFANGAQRADGLQAAINYTTASIAACQSSNWLGTPIFDFPDANPVAVISFTPNATGLGVYTCTATVTVSSTTSGYTSKTFKVALNVARGAVASLAVNFVAMGNAGGDQNVVQNITPDAKVTITNGGRGMVTGVHATVLTATANNVASDWLKTTDLSWEPVVADTIVRPLPATLVVKMGTKPFSASATIRVTGNGISNVDIPVNVLFNVAPELVTNPRGVTVTAFAGGGTQTASVVSFNQNRTVNDSLRNFQRNTDTALPSWITAVNFTPLKTAANMDTAATVAVTIDPAFAPALLADSIYVDTVRVRAETCSTAGGVCTVNSGTFKNYALPVTVIVERGLVVSAANVTLFAPVGNTAVTKDVTVANGGATAISGLSADVGGASWLSASFVGGTVAPTTLRLSASPTGQPRGTVLATTVTVSATTPSGVPSKTFTVTLRVY